MKGGVKEGAGPAPRPVQIAIDGPSAAGKGTLARGLAQALGFAWLDTGLLYRATALQLAAEAPAAAEALRARGEGRETGPAPPEAVRAAARAAENVRPPDLANPALREEGLAALALARCRPRSGAGGPRCLPAGLCRPPHQPLGRAAARCGAGRARYRNRHPPRGRPEALCHRLTRNPRPAAGSRDGDASGRGPQAPRSPRCARPGAGRRHPWRRQPTPCCWRPTSLGAKQALAQALAIARKHLGARLGAV